MRPFLNQMSKMEFLTFLAHFGALNATICTSEFHISSTIQKYGISAFTGKKKLMSYDQNSFQTTKMKFEKISIFFQKIIIFWNFENLQKKQLQELFFFENFIQLQNTLESLQIILRTFWIYRWKAHASLSTTLGARMRPIHFRVKSRI